MPSSSLGYQEISSLFYGVPFILQTDHEPLKYMNSDKFANGRLMRWALFCKAIHSELKPLKAENVEADYLSRADE